MYKLLADISSWYWWISVVAVGLAINLASSYIKPWIDKRLSSRSDVVRARRAKAMAVFESEVNDLASDPTLLLVAGQRLHGAQVTVLSVFTLLGFLLALSFIINLSPSKSTIRAVLDIFIAAAVVVLSVLSIVFTRRESELDEKVRRARKIYHDSVLP